MPVPGRASKVYPCDMLAALKLSSDPVVSDLTKPQVFSPVSSRYPTDDLVGPPLWAWVCCQNPPFCRKDRGGPGGMEGPEAAQVG